MEAIYGSGGTPIKNPPPRNPWSYEKRVPEDGYDPARARKLMAEAGFATGFDTDLWYMPISRPYNPASRRTAEMIADDVSRVGIRARLVTASGATTGPGCRPGPRP